jgi:phosphatidylserine/phosphatidylglycerophosphate/cardiolipin synthase-like enzyme
MRRGHHSPRKKVPVKRIAILLLPVVLWTPLGWAGAALDAFTVRDATVHAYFSPNGGCTEAIVEALGQAKQTILVQAYSFTSAPIAKALVDAHKRGVRVEVILDKSQWTEKYSSADFLAHAGIPTRIDAQHKIAHNKIMVIDGAVVITGSFNFTRGAEYDNAENLLVIRSQALAAQYPRNWETHAEHSEPYMGRGR